MPRLEQSAPILCAGLALEAILPRRHLTVSSVPIRIRPDHRRIYGLLEPRRKPSAQDGGGAHASSPRNQECHNTDAHYSRSGQRSSLERWAKPVVAQLLTLLAHEVIESDSERPRSRNATGRNGSFCD